MAGWGGLLFFICGWFFILGILVGRGLVPVPGEEEPLKKYFTKSKQTAPAGPVSRVKGKPVAPIAATPTAPADRQEAQAKTDSTPVVDKPKKTPGVEQQVRKEAGEKSDNIGNKIFTIQVAALREQQSVGRLFEKLKKEGYAPYMVKATLPDDVTWYRLRCGQFENRDEAAPVLERLRKDGYSPILVRR